MAKLNLRAWGLGLIVGSLVLGLNLAAAQNPPKGKADPKTEKSPGEKSPGEKSPGESPGIVNVEEATNVINKRLADAWKANNITPAERASDYEFIRRASLDIIGRIAKLDEIDKYMKDPPSQRRAMLVDRLLANPEFAEYWSTIWTHWLMTRTGERLYKDQVKLWLAEQFESQNMSIKEMATQLIAAKGKSNDNGAVNYVLSAVGGANPQQNVAKEGQFDMVPITSRTVRLFLGYQIQCTQCHDHPFNADWKQKHFWGVNAFFRQTQRVGNPMMQMQPNMPRPQMVLGDNAEFNKNGIIFFEKRSGVFLPSEPMFLDGTRIPKATGEKTRREILAQFVTGHKNFSRAYVNRMWTQMMGRSMTVKPAFDDFGEHNDVVHDEMLTELGDLFVKANYNPRALMRWIANSEAYGLKAAANKTNDQAEHEVYASRVMLKAMSPEQLLESLIVATRPEVTKNEKELEKFRADWMSRLVVNFGDDEGNEGTFNGTVVQALLMMNGRDINQAISNQQSGTVQSALKLKTGKQTMDYLFLATLNRPATQKEYTQIIAKLPLANGRLKDTDAAGPLQDLFWALLNCNEFILNH
ncbi:MAG: DUF1549 domain-containing protein [Gemmataceae bacterium]|nr:DUF1549 domain-containing protein [Gemmataceae bacterium]